MNKEQERKIYEAETRLTKMEEEYQNKQQGLHELRRRIDDFTDHLNRYKEKCGVKYES
jgi:hypothetical protein